MEKLSLKGIIIVAVMAVPAAILLLIVMGLMAVDKYGRNSIKK